MGEFSERRYLKAKNRIKQIKNFRWFVLIALVASIYMIGFSIVLFSNEGEEAFVPITIFLSSTLGLWIILCLEYIRLFKRNFLLGKTWEEKQIKKYLKTDEQ